MKKPSAIPRNPLRSNSKAANGPQHPHKRGPASYKRLDKRGPAPYKRPDQRGAAPQRPDSRIQAPTRASVPERELIIPEGQYVVDSLSALEVYLRHCPEAIKKIIASERGLAKVAQYPGLSRIPVEVVPGVSHQQISALVEHRTISENTFLDRIASRKEDLLLALDHITDPRNLGAIARSACFFGVKEIIVPKDRQVSFSSAAVATSQGAFAFVDLVEVVNLNRFLRRLKELSYWVLTADMDGEAFEGYRDIYERKVLVLGAEDRGISMGTKKLSDRALTITSAQPGLGSLNVSVATGILLSGLAHREKSSAAVI